jgi:hypothetical protein
MHRTVMPATEWDRELIADLAAERSGLDETQVMGIRGLAAAHETRLLGDVTQMLPIAIPTRRRDREDALVDALRLVGAFGGGPGNLRHRRPIAQEFDALISTMRIASMRGRGGSALMRWGVSPDCTQRQNFFSADTSTLRYSGSMGMVISTHLPPPVIIDSTEVLKWLTHMLC